MKDIKLCRLEKKLSKEEFYRHVLIEVCKDAKIPSDIFNASFEEIEEFETIAYAFFGTAEGSYSGLVGVDREEQYLGTKRMYLNKGSSYTLNNVTRITDRDGVFEVDTVLTRIVTNWSPFNSMLPFTEINCIRFEEKAKLSRIIHKFLRERQNDFTPIDNEIFILDKKMYQNGVMDIESFARSSVNWPGDHHKDEKYMLNVEVTNIFAIKVPCYKISVKWKEEIFEVLGIAVEKFDVDLLISTDNFKEKSIEEVEEDYREEKQEKTEPLISFKKVSKIVGIIFGIIGAACLLNSYLGPILLIFAIIGFVIMIVSFILGPNLERKIEELEKNIDLKYTKIKAKLKLNKILKLDEFLLKNGLEKLSEEEKQNISSDYLELSEIIEGLEDDQFEKNEIPTADIVSQQTKDLIPEEYVRTQYTMLNNSIDEHTRRLEIISLIFLIGAIILSVLFAIIIPSDVDLEFVIPIIVVSTINLIIIFLIPKNKLTNLIIMSTLLLVNCACFFASIGCGTSYYRSYKDEETYEEYYVKYVDRGDYIAVTEVYSNDFDVTIEGTYNNKPVRLIECSFAYDLYFNGSLEQWCQMEFKNPNSNPSYHGCDVYLTDVIFHQKYCLTTAFTIEIPSTIEKINAYAFYNFDFLSNITIPNSVTYIGELAFYNCDSLHSIYIPDSVTYIGELAFSNCDELTVYCEAEYKPSEWELEWKTDEVKVIWDYVEINQDNLVFVIENNEAKLKQYIGRNINVSIPSSISVKEIKYNVTSILSHAFYDRDDLETIYIPASIINVESEAIYDCDHVKVYCEIDEEPLSWEYGWNIDEYGDAKKVFWGIKHFIAKYNENEMEFIVINEKATLKSYIGNDSVLRIPSSIIIDNKDYSVVDIQSEAFIYAENLKVIYIPNSIGDRLYKFSSLILLYEVSKPNNCYEQYNAYWDIKDFIVFEKNEMLFLITDENAVLLKYTGNSKVVEIPPTIEVQNNVYNVTCVGISAFEGCKALVSVTIPEGVTSIDYCAFSYCENLKSITIPGTVTKIGVYAFTESKSLSNVYYTGSIENWCNISFTVSEYGTEYNRCNPCGNLFMLDKNGEWYEVTSIKIPKSVTSIGDFQFVSNNITAIVLHGDITSVGEYAFYGCSNSLVIYCEFEETLDWGSDWNYGHSVYWAGQWEYDVNGNPVPKS